MRYARELRNCRKDNNATRNVVEGGIPVGSSGLLSSRIGFRLDDGRCYVGKQSAKTVNENERRGSRLGKRILFASVEPAGEPVVYPRNVGRWRRVVAPFAIKRAGVPRNRALTNLTNSHHGGV